jgi:hypothetical protein
MKVLFLDFDGVMNNYGDFGRGPDPINPAAVGRLNTIVAQTGARVVISSSWRLKYTLESLRARLGAVGFTGEVVDCTPGLDATGSVFDADPRSARCREIQAWLGAQPEPPESFAILDDADLEAMAAYHVRIDPVTGLCDEHIDTVIALLGAA